jgi:peptidoglycan/LPS O-acetylase OafA/YrhL
MGTFRFVLAVMVMASHFPGVYMKSNLGASAVLVFYFISGWLMAMSYKRFQEKTETPTRDFFIDRFIKIWPSYILVFIISLLFFIYSDVFQFDWRRVWLEILLIPNAFTKMIPWHEPHALNIVPPSWSLGVEAIFYLTVPILAFLSYRLKIFALYAMALGHIFVLSIGVPISHFAACIWPLRESLCTIHISDYFGMDFPLFVGTTFLAGYVAYERFLSGRTDPHIVIVWGLYAFYFFILGPYLTVLANIATYDVTFAIVFLIPSALALLYLTQTLKQPGWDRLLGDMSYPLFLTHFLARFVVEYVAGPLSSNSYFFLQAVGLSMVFTIIVMLFQKQVDNTRYKIRGFASSRLGPKAAGIA